MCCAHLFILFTQQVEMLSCRIEKVYTFLDYIRGGYVGIFFKSVYKCPRVVLGQRRQNCSLVIFPRGL